MNGARSLRALAAPALLAAVVTGVTVPPARAVPIEGTLRGAVWRGSGPGVRLAGSACWLRGPQGEVRIEVSRDGAAPVVPAEPAGNPLLTHDGEGWVVLLTADAAVWGRWGARLEPLPSDSRLRLATLLALLEGGADGDGPWPAGVRPVVPRADAAAGAARAPAVLRLRLPETAPLRAALEARGRGRGGGGETWRVRREASADSSGGTDLVVSSSRFPGRVALRAAGSWPVGFEPDDAFVPVWPLGELLDFPGARPGGGFAGPGRR